MLGSYMKIVGDLLVGNLSKLGSLKKRARQQVDEEKDVDIARPKRGRGRPKLSLEQKIATNSKKRLKMFELSVTIFVGENDID